MPPLSLSMAPPLSTLFHAALSVSRFEIFVIASLFVGLIFVLSYLRWRRRIRSYPPGPPPDPILGNARQLVKIDNQERAFAGWERAYGQSSSPPLHVVHSADLSLSLSKGDVNYLSVFNKSILILNSFSAARDLLEKRGAIYSSRPTLVMLCEM